ncbi:MAG: phage/plasmid primase, P4 family [Fermentimonas sp.]|nr:phage/plasmid primase, P4 family [Fermentimonas sp.]
MNKDSVNGDSVNGATKNDVVDLLNQEMVRFRKSTKEKRTGSELTAVKLKHYDIPEYICDRLEKVDFEEVSHGHYIYTCTQKIIETAENCGYGLCCRDGMIYLYNGEYWRQFPLPAFQNFMGKSAVKMGVKKSLGGIYYFKEQLAKQFMSVAYRGDYEDNPEGSKKALVNLKNGTFEISKQGLRLRKPDKDDFLTYQLNFEYDEKAKCPLFDKFLDRVLPDKTLQMILAEYIGYLFIRTEDLKLEKVLLLYGSGANGKSVVFEVVYALLGGKTNVSNFSLENLTNSNGYYRAMLGGKLLNYSTEINGKLNESVFKQLASGEPVDARVPYGEPFTLTNYGKMMFNCNALPVTSDHSDAFYRRFLIIPFDVSIPVHEQDKQLAKKITVKELPGVFNWVLEGFKRLITQKGFTESRQTDAINNDYRMEGNSVALFIEDAGYSDSQNETIPIGDLYEKYRTYCVKGKHVSVNKRIFTSRLRAEGHKIVRRNYGMAIYLEKHKSVPSVPSAGVYEQ